jgi:broad specificity phosphatase PhoE
MANRTSGEPGRATQRTVVYLVRHGQTELNESGVFRGLLNPPLNEVGREQASRLGAALGPRRPAAVIASPLRRAIETAEPVAVFADLNVQTDQCLLDRDYGQWTGTEQKTVDAEFGSIDNAPGVEPLAAVRKRAVDGLTGIARHHQGSTVVVVSHDAVNRQVLQAFRPDLGDPDAIPQDNGCFNTLEWSRERWAVLSVNEVPGTS